MVAAVRNKAAITKGRIGGVEAEVMLDSGSSVSLVRQEVLSQAPKMPSVTGVKPIQLVTASGDPLKILDHVQAPVKIGDLELVHDFVVVENLVSPVILGVDFLHKNGLVLDFSSLPVTVHTSDSAQVISHYPIIPECIVSIYSEERRERTRICAVEAIEAPCADVIENCAVPYFHASLSFDYPECSCNDLLNVIHTYRSLFRTVPGETEVASHYITTTGTPV